MAKVKMDTTAIKLMIKKAIAFELASVLLVEMSSISLKRVLDERHEKTINNANGIRIAIIVSGILCSV
jgi:hypothetical protein